MMTLSRWCWRKPTADEGCGISNHRICNNVTFFSDVEVLVPEMRLPKGFSGLRPDLGLILKARRKWDYGKQHDVAERAGIARETLSRIERGHTKPSPETLDRLLQILEIDWDAIAIRGTSERVSRPFDGSSEGEWRFEFGKKLRNCRRASKLSLREVASLAGLSAAQLSRIERGQVTRGRAFEKDLREGDLLKVVIPYLLSLVDMGLMSKSVL